MALPSGYPHFIQFHDFGIPLRGVQQREGAKTFTHWAYTTMPRILPDMERCVFFLYASPDDLEPGGTGFFFTKAEGGVLHTYAISNVHVVEDHPRPRLRSATGEWHDFPISPARWQSAVSGDDLAAVDVTDDIHNHAEPFPIHTVEEELIADKPTIAKFDIGIGDEAFMIGLYLDSRESEYRSPVGRFGCLAALADPAVLVRTENKKCKPRPAHLIDMRSRDGFSGSPVFVYRTPVTNLQCIAENGDWDLRAMNNLFLYLLGVHYGQFPETVSAKRDNEDGDAWEIASSMTTVVPAWQITDLLNRPEFVLQRKDRIAMSKKPKKAVKLERKPPRSRRDVEPNPDHRDDFKRLLGAAVKPPKSSG